MLDDSVVGRSDYQYGPLDMMNPLSSNEASNYSLVERAYESVDEDFPAIDVRSDAYSDGTILSKNDDNTEQHVPMQAEINGMRQDSIVPLVEASIRCSHPFLLSPPGPPL